MTTLAQPRHATTEARRVAHSFVDTLSALTAAWQRARRQRAALRELEALSDHMLHDIGLSRSELYSIVAEVTGAAPATRRHVMQRMSGRAAT